MKKLLLILERMGNVYKSDDSIREARTELEKSIENLKKLENGLDDIFTENEKLCENGISSFETHDRLVEINEKIADLQCLIPSFK